MKPQQLVLDAYALMVFFEDEAAADQVEKVLIKAEKGDLELFLTMINLGELFYIFERESGEISALQMLAMIDGLPITQLELRRNDVLAAAKIKAHYPVSYADAFAIAAAREFGCPVMTGDPEFKKVAHLVEITWLQSREAEE